MKHRIALLVVVAGLIVAGCGDDDTTTTAPATTSTAGVTTTAGAVAPAVTIVSFAFQPNRLEIALGETVTFTVGEDSHTTTSTGNWDSGGLGVGESFDVTPTAAGTYEFFCKFHPTRMMGTLTVTG